MLYGDLFVANASMTECFYGRRCGRLYSSAVLCRQSSTGQTKRKVSALAPRPIAGAQDALPAADY